MSNIHFRLEEYAQDLENYETWPLISLIFGLIGNFYWGEFEAWASRYYHAKTVSLIDSIMEQAVNLDNCLLRRSSIRFKSKFAQAFDRNGLKTKQMYS